VKNVIKIDSGDFKWGLLDEMEGTRNQAPPLWPKRGLAAREEHQKIKPSEKRKRGSRLSVERSYRPTRGIPEGLFGDSQGRTGRRRGGVCKKKKLLNKKRRVLRGFGAIVRKTT